MVTLHPHDPRQHGEGVQGEGGVIVCLMSSSSGWRSVKCGISLQSAAGPPPRWCLRGGGRAEYPAPSTHMEQLRCAVKILAQSLLFCLIFHPFPSLQLVGRWSIVVGVYPPTPRLATPHRKHGPLAANIAQILLCSDQTCMLPVFDDLAQSWRRYLILV